MKKSFILYTDFYDSIKILPDLEKGRLLTAIFEYVINGKENNTKNTTGMAFSFIKKTLDRDAKKWNALVSRNRRNILSRWQKSRLKDDTKNTSGKTGIPNPLDSDSDSVSVSDSDINNIDTSAKNSLTPCTNEELYNIALLVKTKLDNVLKKHTDILLLIKSGEFQRKYKDKTVYYTLIKWLRGDIAKGYLEPMSEFEELTIKSFHPVTGNQKDKYVRYWDYCKKLGVI